jgi:hypothetical protein
MTDSLCGNQRLEHHWFTTSPRSVRSGAVSFS